MKRTFYMTTDPDWDEVKKNKDKNACTVIALAKVMDSDYPTCYKFMASQGRKHGRGMYDDDVDKAFLSMKNTKVVKGPYSLTNRITVSKFIEKHPVGRFFVCSRGHAFAIIDGIVHDYKRGDRRQIKLAWRVYLVDKDED